MNFLKRSARARWVFYIFGPKKSKGSQLHGDFLSFFVKRSARARCFFSHFWYEKIERFTTASDGMGHFFNFTTARQVFEFLIEKFENILESSRNSLSFVRV